MPGSMVVLSHITERFHATLIIVSDLSVTLLQKTYAQGVAQVSTIANGLQTPRHLKTDILTSFTNRHFSVGYTALTFRKLMLA